MIDITDPVVIEKITEKAIEYAPYICMGLGGILFPIYLKCKNGVSNNNNAQFNVSRYIQEFDRVKLNNNINKKDKNKGIF